MSALPPKADIDYLDGHVRFVPKADIMRCSKQPLFDHLDTGQDVGVSAARFFSLAIPEVSSS
jgi:hypothetical protein